MNASNSMLMEHRHRIARNLLLSVSSFGLIAIGAQAHAQTSPQQSGDPTVAQAPGTPASIASESDVAGTGVASDQSTEAGEIVVTGYRRSLEESVARKRNADAFIDVITAEDVGKFPDKNVADALQRVPGVVITRDGGEGARVSIRGLQPGLSLTLLNGNFLAGADSGQPQRSFNYVLLPSTFIASTEVYKSPEARIEEGGVGGTIILNTRRPLDVPSLSGFVSAEGVYADTTEKFEPQLAGQISWKNQDETIGFLVGGVYQKRSNRELRGGAGPWRWWSDRTNGVVNTRATDVNGNPYSNDAAISYWPGSGQATVDGSQRYSGYWAPQVVTAEVFDQDRERWGVQATGQVKPTDELTITSNYFRFQYSSDFVANRIQVPEWGYGRFFTGATLDPSGTIFQSANFNLPAPGTGCLAPANPTTTPICTMETPWLTGTYSREKQVSNTFETEARYERDRFTAVLKLGKTKAEGGPSTRFSVAVKPRLTVRGQEANGSTYSNWNISGGRVNFEFDPAVQDNIKRGIAQVDIGSTGSGFDNSEISQRYTQLDLTRSFDGSFLRSVQIGAKWRDLRILRETGRNEWYTTVNGQQRRYQDTPDGAVARPEFFYDKPIGNITGGFTTNIMPGIDFERFLNYIDTTYGPSTRVPEPNNLYRVGEEVLAGYAQINFGTGGFRGNIGLRVARTNQTSDTSDRLAYNLDYCVDGPNGPFSTVGRPLGADGNCLIRPLAERELILNVRTGGERNYTDWLPSLNLSYELTPKLLIRGAVAKTVARPALSDLGGARSLTFNSPEFTFDRAEFGAFGGWSGSGGNPDLLPFQAWQYDAGIEWYFARGSVLGATAFRKDVKNFVVPLTLDVTRDVAGEQVLIRPYSTQANGGDAVSQGVEVYAQHTLPFGLGAQANFTFNDTSSAEITLNGQSVGSSALVGSARTQINGSVFYENDRLLLRASYNRRGEVVGGLSSGLNVYTAPFEQVDINASFEVMKNVVLTASVINLTKSEERSYLGNDTEARLTNRNYFGRRGYIGLAYNF